MIDLSVNYQALVAGSEGLTTEERALLQRIEDLHARLNAVAAGWTGEAQQAFRQNMLNLTQELNDLAVVLSRTGNQLVDTASAFQAVDRRSAQGF
ncbi:WXG100 family type VII secretion target [Streptomyces millisiae]|uniref:ESAT-6-like protein n=1 Tax=Streptomyces millisiae TaxID=3075542 RepID=A0ABU2LTW0_9ACTN|nr:WXG100 family type VII secretion target [Streptomyces sp. DSM 44918]MDT0321039.1 WXG100 family type VII secretion target [Streptomyces sp. DSM 44918]